MGNLIIDLSKQEYEVFDITKNTICLSNKNYLYGKNGSGKSSLCELITKQYEGEYDVRVFTGFNSVIKDKRLDAVVLGNENITAKAEIEDIKEKIKQFRASGKKLCDEVRSLDWKDEYVTQGIKKNILLEKKDEISKKLDYQRRRVDTYYQEQAKIIKSFSVNGISKPSYNKNDFIEEIPKGKELNSDIIDRNEKLLKSEPKNKVTSNIKLDFDGFSILKDVNNLLKSSVSESEKFSEFDKSNDKRIFAEMGLKLHEPGENCSFCGNEIKPDRIKRLSGYFHTDDITQFQKKLKEKYEKIKEINKTVDEITLLDINQYYENFKEDVRSLNLEIETWKDKVKMFLSRMESEISEKQKNMFKASNEVELDLPKNLESLKIKVNYIVNKNNELTLTLDRDKQKAADELRYHYVKKMLDKKEEYKIDWKGLEVEKYEIDNYSNELERISSQIHEKIKIISGDEFSITPDTIEYYKQEIIKLETIRTDLLSKTQSTELLAERINRKLKYMGKDNIQLILTKDKKDNEEIEHYQICGISGIRSIDKISTGEMNIIAFLYFLEDLEKVRSEKNKIIIFDDPVNSNDEIMQYLIITEIQKLYQGKYRNKFDHDNDYLICMTHNVHFYLNVQPQGCWATVKKDPSNPEGPLLKETKYDKNTFLHLDQGKFKQILSERDDIATQYDSLWMELGNLYKYNMLNSMLNSMRRILETYMNFNKKNPDDFYKGLDEHRKLFNVNSHGIDDPSMSTIGKSKEDLLVMFKEAFKNNDAETHYDSFVQNWVLEQDNK